MPALDLKFIGENGNWRLDIPDSVDAQKLHANLTKALTDLQDVNKLGAVLLPYLNQSGVDDPALSPELAPPPVATTFLLHGHDDNIIPPAESVLLANHLKLKGVRTKVLLSGLITHASVNEHATAMDALKLVNFWAAVIKQ